MDERLPEKLGGLEPVMPLDNENIPEEIIDETVEEAANRLTFNDSLSWENDLAKESFIKGSEWKEKIMHEDIINALHSVELKDNKNYSKIYEGMKDWFEKNKKK
jgi:hypothetical protein